MKFFKDNTNKKEQQKTVESWWFLFKHFCANFQQIIRLEWIPTAWFKISPTSKYSTTDMQHSTVQVHSSTEKYWTWEKLNS